MSEKTEAHLSEGVQDVAVSGKSHSEGEGAAAPRARWEKWLGYVWDTIDYPKEERWLLFKADAFLLSIFCLGYFVKSLDQTNINNAFLSGMKEDLNMYGNELVHAVTIYNVGYIIGEIPFNIILTRVPAHYAIAILELGVGAATLGCYAVHSIPALYAARFFSGFFEGGYFPGVFYVLSSWYTPKELAKRGGLFYATGALGSMFSGFLQSAAYNNLDGHNGLAGWRWLFIIDAIFTFGTAILTFFFLVDIPWHCKPDFKLSADEIELAKTRMTRIAREAPTPWTFTKVKKFVSHWQFFLFPIAYALYNTANPQQPMGYWLKSFNAHPPPVPGRHYTVSQINLLPLPYLAIAVVMTYGLNWLSDGPLKGRRWPIVFICSAGAIAVAGALRNLEVYGSYKAHFALYYLVYWGYASGPTIMTWAAEHTQFDNELRAVVLAICNVAAYILQAIVPNIVWKTVNFPAARTGMTYSISCNSVLIVVTLLIMFLIHREKKIAARRKDEEYQAPPSPASNDEKALDSDSVTSRK